MKQTKVVWLIFLSALLLRLVFLFPQYSGDVRNHLVWGNSFLDSPVDFYSRHFPGFNDANYPPLAIFLFAISGFLYQTITSLFSFLNLSFSAFPSLLVPLFEHENMQLGFMKLPSIFADLGIGYLIYKFTSSRHPREGGDPFNLPLIFASLYLFNPAVIYLSSVWGQIEPVTNFFLLLSLYTAAPILPRVSNNSNLSFPRRRESISNIHSLYSIAFFTLAALTKQTALWFAPFYLFIWLKNLPLRQFMVGILSSALIFFASYLPFGLNPFAALKNYFATLGGSSSGVSDAAWNFWYLLYPGGAEDSVRLGLFSVRQISSVLLIFLFVLLLYKLFKNYQLRTFLNYLFLWSLAVFFLQTRVHERHLAPALVFALLTPGLTKRFFADYFLVSAYHMYNLYSVIRLPFI